FGYDAINRLASVTDTLNNLTTYKYDNCSNLTEIVHPLGHAEFLAYDPLHTGDKLTSKIKLLLFFCK
ncbi:MAG: RHS repeat domain-containing protein, partial [Eubacteriales bacterium]